MVDAYSLYRVVREKAKECDDEELSRSLSYKTLEASYPHVAKAILLEARLRRLKVEASEASSLSERQRIKLEAWKVERELQRERLLQRSRWEYLQWRSRELRSTPRRTLEKLGAKLARGFSNLCSNLCRRMVEGFFKAMPPSISYLGTWGFSSEELIRWSKGYLRARTPKPPRKPLIRGRVGRE